MPPDSSDSQDNGDVYTFRYPPEEDEQPALALVNAVAWVKGVDAADLEPIGRVVNVDALSDLLRSSDEFYRSSSDEDSCDLLVSFTYEDSRVTVRPGEIEIRDS